MKNSLVVAILLTASMGIASAAKNAIYFIPPAGYVYKDGRLLIQDTLKEDNFSRSVSTVREKFEKADYHFVATSWGKKLKNLAGLIVCDLPEEKLKTVKKYPKEKVVLLTQYSQWDLDTLFEKAHRDNFGKILTVKNDNFADVILTHFCPSCSAEVDEAPVDSLILSIILGPSKMKEGEKATLSVITDGGRQPLTYRWSDGQEGQHLDSISVSPTKTTQYTVKVSDSSRHPVVLTSYPHTLEVEPLIKPVEKKPQPQVVSQPAQKPQPQTVTAKPTLAGPLLVAAAQGQSQKPNFTVSIEGKRVYKADQLIQLTAQPSGAAYLWKGPHNFEATTQKISLVASAVTAGLYTIHVQSAGETKSAEAHIVVLPADPLPTNTIVASNVPVTDVKPAQKETRKPVCQLAVRVRNLRTLQDVVSFSLMVHNRSAMIAKNIVLTDVLPAGLELISAKGMLWDITPSQDGFTARGGAITVGEIKSIEVKARIVNRPKGNANHRATIVNDGTSPTEYVDALL